MNGVAILRTNSSGFSYAWMGWGGYEPLIFSDVTGVAHFYMQTGSIFGFHLPPIFTGPSGFVPLETSSPSIFWRDAVLFSKMFSVPFAVGRYETLTIFLYKACRDQKYPIKKTGGLLTDGMCLIKY